MKLNSGAAKVIYKVTKGDERNLGVKKCGIINYCMTTRQQFHPGVIAENCSNIHSSLLPIASPCGIVQERDMTSRRVLLRWYISN